MSNTTLNSGSAKSADLVYEEDQQPSQGAEDGNPNLKTSISAVGEAVKSKNTILIETFLNQYLQETNSRLEGHRKTHGSTSRDHGSAQKTVSVLDFEIDRIDTTFVHSALSDIFSLKVRYQVLMLFNVQ